MSIFSSVTTILGLIILFLGLFIFLFQIVGFIKYKFILNRMHAAGMGDTLGIFMCLFGLVLISGFNYTSAKLLLVIMFLWFASPTATHLISRLEAATDEEINKYVDVQIGEDIDEYFDAKTEESVAATMNGNENNDDGEEEK